MNGREVQEVGCESKRRSTFPEEKIKHEGNLKLFRKIHAILPSIWDRKTRGERIVGGADVVSFQAGREGQVPCFGPHRKVHVVETYDAHEQRVKTM